jgi:aryl-alcohol dehydrogenase-like predicted oxidoreductase
MRLEAAVVEYRALGQGGPKISVIGFGCWQMGGMDCGPVSDEDTSAAALHALDLGMNFFDTAAVYGFGHSEEVLGRTLAGRRHEAFIATKGGLEWDSRGNVRTNSQKNHILKAADASLRRLNIESIDLYQIHWPDPQTPIDEPAEALEELIRAGKMRYAGVSNYSAKHMELWRKKARLQSLQPLYNMLQREAEVELLPYCLRSGVGVVVYSPLAKGLLAGKLTPGSKFGPDDSRSRDPLFQGEAFRRNLDIVEKLRLIARRDGKTVAQLALAWALANPAVTCTIVGAKRPSQIEEAAGGSDYRLRADALREIEGVLAGNR